MGKTKQYKNNNNNEKNGNNKTFYTKLAEYYEHSYIS